MVMLREYVNWLVRCILQVLVHQQDEINQLRNQQRQQQVKIQDLEAAVLATSEKQRRVVEGMDEAATVRQTALEKQLQQQDTMIHNLALRIYSCGVYKIPTRLKHIAN